MGDAPSRPVVRLRPPPARAAGRAPTLWAYADEIVLDRRTRAIAGGTVVELQDAERRPVGSAAFNPVSKIAARLLDPDPAAAIDAGWFAGATRAGRSRLRETLFDAPYYRLVHAEADGLPGVVVDRFGDAAVVQPNAAWAEARLPDLVAALVAVTGVTTVVKNAAGRARALEGLDDASAVVAGALDGPVAVPMNGATYFADLAQGQKTGLFYDQRPNHAFAARLARGRAMLDVFAHVGGFALAGAGGGGDGRRSPSTARPRRSSSRRGAPRPAASARGSRLRRADAFDAMAALAGEGRRFGVVVCDPPAFAPNKAALEAGLRAYERVARLGAALVEPGGFLVVCSCSHAADLGRFREASLRGVAKAGRSAQIIHVGGAGPDHPVHPALAETAVSEGAVPAARRMRVALDACVLFPTVLREMLLGAAAAGGFAPVWSARILEEWARATRRLPEGAEAVARAEIALLRAAWPGGGGGGRPGPGGAAVAAGPGRPPRARRGDRRRGGGAADAEPGGFPDPDARPARHRPARAGRLPDRAPGRGRRPRRGRRGGARPRRAGVGAAAAAAAAPEAGRAAAARQGARGRG